MSGAGESDAALGGAVQYGSVGNDLEKDCLLKQANCPNFLSNPLSSQRYSQDEQGAHSPH